MTTCRGCGALVQPEWDRCKICGWDGSEPEVVLPEGRAGRRARKADKAQKTTKTTPTVEYAAPPSGGTDTLTVDLPPPPRAAPAPPRSKAPGAARKPKGQSETPVWLLAAALVAVIAGCLVIIFKDPDDSSAPPSDVPAAESDPEAGAPEWESLGEWDEYSSSLGGFSVEMPGLPIEEADRMTVPSVGLIELNKATAVSTGTTTTAGWAVIPEGLRDNPDLMLNGLIRAEADALEGEVAAQKEVTVDGMPALRARVESTIGEVRLVAIAGQNYVYLLQADAGDQGTLYLQRLIDTFDA
jgi:hypothetical protein